MWHWFIIINIFEVEHVGRTFDVMSLVTQGATDGSVKLNELLLDRVCL